MGEAEYIMASQDRDEARASRERWKARAERAEAEVTRLREALEETLTSLELMGAGKTGTAWVDCLERAARARSALGGS